MNSRPMPLTPRTSRDVCRDACALQLPQRRRRSLGHALIVPVGIACLIALFFIVRLS